MADNRQHIPLKTSKTRQVVAQLGQVVTQSLITQASKTKKALQYTTMKPTQEATELTQKQAETEIKELHVFFEEWLSGKLEQNHANFERFSSVMDDRFHIINPAADLSGKAQLWDGLYNAHGVQPSLKIWIENVQVHFETREIIVATYEEWQTIQDKTTARLSSVSFSKNSDAPNNVIWLHVHETWLKN